MTPAREFGFVRQRLIVVRQEQRRSVREMRALLSHDRRLEKSGLGYYCVFPLGGN
jgi:hypothetical protein